MRTGWWTLAVLAACCLPGCTDGDPAAVGLSATVAPDTVDGSVSVEAAGPADAATSEGATPPASEVAMPSPTTTPSEPVAPSGAPPANAAALDFTARRLGGGTIDGAQLAGGDVVLWMWAPWCPQCNREAAHVAEVAAAHGDDVTFVGIAGHDEDDAHRAFVDRHGLGDLVDDDGSLWEQYGIDYQPAWVLVDDDGTTEVVAGGLYDELEDRVQELVDR